MRQFIKRLVLSVVFIITTAFGSLASEWALDKEKSVLNYVAVVQGKENKGRFEKIDGKIVLDVGNPQAGNIEMTVDTGSINTGNTQGNGFVTGAQWLGIEAFPKATFKSEDISKSGGTYTANGTLSVRGIVKPVILTFTLDVKDDRGIAVGTADITRTAFEVGSAPSKTLPIDDEVLIQFEIHASRIN